jgi:hypothetical protein
MHEKKGFYSLDLLFSFLPIVFMFNAIMGILVIANYDIYVEEQARIVKRVFIASEYIVNYNAKTTYKTFPNWIENFPDSGQLKESLGLKELNIGLEKGPGNCITRMIAFGESKEIKKIFVCGG